MGTGNIPLICFYDGKLINEDRNAKYEGGNKKAENVSNTIGFKEFNEKIRDMIQLPSSDDFKFKIKCGLCFDQETLIAVDVDDDKSLSYVFDHSKFIRAYIIKQEPSVTVITTQRQERSFPSRVIGNLHRGINDSEPCFTDDAGTDTSFQYDIDFVQPYEDELKLTKLYNLMKLDISTDSTTVLEYLTKDMNTARNLRHIIRRIKSMLGQLDQYNISHDSREINRIADKLASLLPNSEFIENIPSSFADLKNIVHEDRIGKTYLRM